MMPILYVLFGVMVGAIVMYGWHFGSQGGYEDEGEWGSR